MSKPHNSKTKAKARGMVEKGESLRTVADALGIDHKTVLAWSRAGEWKKGALVPALEQKEQETALAEAARLGLTRARVTQKVLDLMDAQSVAVITTQGAISLCALKPGEYDDKADFQGIAYDVVPDRRTQMEATKLGADILGMKKADQESERTNDNLLTLIRSMRPK
jgi:hypothetical protein